MIQSASPSPTVSVVAWYGAVVSTLGFGLALYVALRDRPRLRISVQANMKTFDDPTKFVVVTVANRGRRPVTLSAVWLTPRAKSSGEFLLGESAQPREVGEGKSVSYLANQEHLKREVPYRVGIRDQAGRVWRRRIPRAVRQALTPTTNT